MKRSLTLAGALIGAAALTLSACAQAPGTEHPVGRAERRAPVPARRRWRLQGLHGLRLRWLRRQVVQPDLVQGPDRRQDRAGHRDRPGRVRRPPPTSPRTSSRWSTPKCNIIVTVGFLLSDDTLAAAKKNPDIKFAIVDNNDPKTYPAAKNLKPLVFNTAQSSFLAGYLAAGMTKTKKVGTFGGAKIPTVTIFMDGFAQGVDYYNKQKGEQRRRCSAGTRPSRTASSSGRSRSRTEGRPADGPGPDQPGRRHRVPGRRSGRSSARCRRPRPAAARSTRSGWTPTAASARRATAPASSPASTRAWTSPCSTRSRRPRTASFSNEPFVGTLENDGTGLAPFHDFDSKVPADLKTELDALKADIISGKIKIESKSQPTS